MENRFQKLLTEVEVLEPVNVDGFQVFGLRRSGDSQLSYITLDEALSKKALEVTEVSEGGTVPTLKVVNKGESMIFLMAGEQLIGAKQNRVLNVSIMVGSKSELPIPVSCVESGRWRYSSRSFSSGRTSSHSVLRAKMAKDAIASYRLEGTPSSRQAEVWDEVSRKLESMGSNSPSSALDQVYQDYEAGLKKVTEELQAPGGCSGAVFAFGGRIAGMDLFDQSSTLGKLWPKLLRSYLIDALEKPADQPKLGRESVLAWLRSALTAKSEKYNSPGLGEDMRLEAENLVGSTLIVDNESVHTELFSSLPPDTPKAPRGYPA